MNEHDRSVGAGCELPYYAVVSCGVTHEPPSAVEVHDDGRRGLGLSAMRTFSEKHKLAQDLANAVMRWEKVPPINLFKNNTAAFVHELPAGAISNAAGESNYVRVQVLTPIGVLDRDKQLGVVRELTGIVAAAANDPSLADRTWVLITESPKGGWGINGHANTGADIVAATRAELGKSSR